MKFIVQQANYYFISLLILLTYRKNTMNKKSLISNQQHPYSHNLYNCAISLSYDQKITNVDFSFDGTYCQQTNNLGNTAKILGIQEDVTIKS
jgi:ABC-type oligopeptide transport system ATPase subunit